MNVTRKSPIYISFKVKMSVLSEVMTRKYDLAQLFCFHVCLVWLVLGDDFHNLEIRFNIKMLRTVTLFWSYSG